MTVPCWQFRYEARNEDPTPTLEDILAGVQPDPYDGQNDMCVLDEDHEGAHRFVSQDAVGLTFVGPPARVEGGAR